MIPYIIGGLVGLAVAGRSKPRAKFRKLKILGPQTGVTYEVDVCPGESVIIVHAAETAALFQKIAGSPGYRLLRQLTGRKDAVDLMRRDLEPPPKPPPSEASENAAE